MRPTLIALTSLFAATCASQPQAKPVAIDPSNPAAAEGARPPTGELTPASRGATAAPPAASASAPPPHDHASHTAEAGAAAESAPAPPKPSPSGAHDHAGAGAPSKQKTVYTCPMHPEVVSDKPGRCPKCGMNLKKKSDASDPGGKK